MSEAWTESTLGEVASITIGRTPPRDQPRFWTTDLTRPFCTIADMASRWVDPVREGVTEEAELLGKAKRVPAGSLLMSFKLTIGRIGFASRDLFPNEAIAWLTPSSPGLTAAYLALYLSAQDLAEGSGRAVKGNTLNGASLRAIPVRFPRLAEQRRIVDLVGALDAQLEALAVEVGFLRAVLTSIREELVATVVWRPVSTLTAPGGVQIGPFGSQLHAYDYTDDGVPVVMPQDILEGEIHTTKVKYISEDTAKTLARHRLRAGDLVLPRRGDLSKRALVKPEQDGWLCGTGSIRLRLSDPTMAPALLEGLSTQRTDEWLTTNAVGTTMLNLNTEIVSNLPAPIFSDDDRELAEGCVSVDRVIRRAHAEQELLRVARTSLLGDLLSGEIEIPDSYDAFLEAV